MFFNDMLMPFKTFEQFQKHLKCAWIERPYQHFIQASQGAYKDLIEALYKHYNGFTQGA